MHSKTLNQGHISIKRNQFFSIKNTPLQNAMISYGYSCNTKSGTNKKHGMHFCRFLVLYYDGALERQCKRQSKRGKEMFGFRVGKFLALGIVPDGHSPSLYKQFLLLLLFVFPFHANPSHTASQKRYLKVPFLAVSSVSRPGTSIFHPQPQIFGISKINTTPNARLTQFRCGWFCFQFSHHLSHPTSSEEKEKTFVQTTTTKKAIQTRKGHFCTHVV